LHLVKVTPPSIIDSAGNKVKGKAYDFGCPACKKESAYVNMSQKPQGTFLRAPEK
jgi:DNA topoisomerase-1